MLKPDAPVVTVDAPNQHTLSLYSQRGMPLATVIDTLRQRSQLPGNVVRKSLQCGSIPVWYATAQTAFGILHKNCCHHFTAQFLDWYFSCYLFKAHILYVINYEINV